ncbi:transposase [Rubellimicrobium roseum]|uniref:Transposase n=2 Tax=Rubellimicrobium roseum TaxID=687525 RepID=A0A5C4N791_9RHOB|nr:transposase [Rubellimicrobium roseum]
MRFVALDVETANADMASICSLGAAVFENGQLVSEWYSLINPEDYFDPLNISIHGICEKDVQGAPTFEEVTDELHRHIGEQIVVTHTHFDRVAIHQAASRYALPSPTCRWLDSSQVARRTWADCARSGYGLSKLCSRIGYTFAHHNALEDAKACGHVLLAAMRDGGLDLESALLRVRRPIDLSFAGPITREGNPDGALAGEVLVFTGALAIPRREAADLAASVGCEVAVGVTRQTTVLVVGDMDVQKLAGHQKSSKHRKAEDLIAAGVAIRIIRETDFRELVMQG